MSPKPSPIAIYGATGVTGQLLLDALLARGLPPRLIGRNAARLQLLAAQHDLPAMAAPLEDAVALATALAGVEVLVNVAGPFAETAPPLLAACLAARCDYLDLNGELTALRLLLAQDAAAKTAGVACVGAIGFGIAATDALVRRVADALGGVDRLRLSVAADSAFGTAAVVASTLAVLAAGGHEVAAGQIVPARLARRRWHETTSDGARIAFASAPLADLAGALDALGGAAVDIVAGVPMPAGQALAVSAIAPLLPTLLRVPAVARQLANTGGHGGGAAAVHRSRACVTGWRGAQRQGLMLAGGEGFALAAAMAATAVERHLARRPPPGAHGPAAAYGADWIDAVPGIVVSAI